MPSVFWTKSYDSELNKYFYISPLTGGLYTMAFDSKCQQRVKTDPLLS